MPRAFLNNSELLAGAAIPANEWHHIAWVYDDSAGKLRIYVDGVKDANELTVDAITANRLLFIGFWQHWNPGSSAWETLHFKGMMEELRIWNIAREAAALQEDLDDRLDGDEAGLTSYWTFTGENRRQIFGRSANRQHVDYFEVADTSINGKFADISANPPEIANPRSNPSCDGYNDYLNVLKTETAYPDQWTIECWINPDTN